MSDYYVNHCQECERLRLLDAFRTIYALKQESNDEMAAELWDDIQGYQRQRYFHTCKDDGSADTNNGSDVCWWTQQKDGYTWLSDCGHWYRFSIEWFDGRFAERMRRCQFCGKPARGLVIPVSGTSDEDCE